MIILGPANQTGLAAAALLLALGTAAVAQSTTATPLEQPVEGVLEPTGELVADPEAPPSEAAVEAVDKQADEELEAAEKDLKNSESDAEPTE